MKKFETPVVEIEKFDLADVIATSVNTDICTDDVVECDNQTETL